MWLLGFFISLFLETESICVSRLLKLWPSFERLHATLDCIIKGGHQHVTFPGWLKGKSSTGEVGSVEWRMWLRRCAQTQNAPENLLKHITCVVVFCLFQGVQVDSQIKHLLLCNNGLKYYNACYSVCRC